MAGGLKANAMASGTSLASLALTLFRISCDVCLRSFHGRNATKKNPL
jgi:hypothetical protein